VTKRSSAKVQARRSSVKTFIKVGRVLVFVWSRSACGLLPTHPSLLSGY
jgi:hypothetical protein